MTRKLWVIALAIWMGVYCIISLTDVGVKYRDLIMGILAGAVCILAFLDK